MKRDMNAYRLILMFIFFNIIQLQKLIKKDMLTEISFLRRKDKKHQKKKVNCKFIRINTSRKSYDGNYEISKVSACITESFKKQTEESTKKSLIDDLSKRLLELKFKSNHSIKSKCLKWIVKKILPIISKWQVNICEKERKHLLLSLQKKKQIIKKLGEQH